MNQRSMERVVTISSVSSDYKVYQAGSGQPNAKQSRQGHHHAFDEQAAGSAPASTAEASTAGTMGSVGNTIFNHSNRKNFADEALYSICDQCIGDGYSKI